MKWVYRYLIAALFLGLCIYDFPAWAEMTPREILESADRARGNVEGIEWMIEIESIERGRRQNRTIRVMARGYNSLAEFMTPPKVKGQKLLIN